MKKHALAFLSMAIAFSAIGLRADAQEAIDTSVSFCPSHGEATVSVAIKPLPAKIVSGASLPMTVRISNLKDYPLSSGMLLVRLISAEPVNKSLAGMSGAVFGRSVPVDDMFIGSNASKEFSFILQLPSRLPSGAYLIEAVYALSESDIQEVDAAPWAGKVNAGILSVTVESPFSDGFAYVDAKTASTTEDIDGEVSVSVDIVNPGKEEAVIPLLWNVHYTSAISDKTTVSSTAETIRVPAAGKVNVSYVIPDTSHSLYETIAEAISGGVRSFATMRAQDIRGEALVRLLGIAPSDDGHTAFACISNVFTDDEESREISLSVTDGSGMVLGSKTFAVQGDMNDLEFSLPFEIRGTGDVIVAAGAVSQSGAKQYFEKSFRCTDLGTCLATNQLEPGMYLPVFGITMLAAGLGGLLAMMCRPNRKKKLEVRSL